jgi:hypothetical protein
MFFTRAPDENDASDIRLSTLIRIVQQGFGGKLNLSVEM